jgi:hypothetical protein
VLLASCRLGLRAARGCCRWLAAPCCVNDGSSWLADKAGSTEPQLALLLCLRAAAAADAANEAADEAQLACCCPLAVSRAAGQLLLAWRCLNCPTPRAGCTQLERTAQARLLFLRLLPSLAQLLLQACYLVQHVLLQLQLHTHTHTHTHTHRAAINTAANDRVSGQL